jgi:hypothetical protein
MTLKSEHKSEYQAWQSMKQRCLNPNDVQYEQYGGRGIDVSDRWANSFAEFMKDMGPKPGPKYTLERIDNNEGYYSWNCKWATYIEQNNNSRINKPERNKQIKTLYDCGYGYGKLSEMFNVDETTISRIVRS